MTSTVRGPGPGVTDALVGRERESALVLELVERTTARSGGVLLLEGEAGIGKSALLDVAATAAWAQGCLLLRGAADELEGSRPFGALADAVSALGPEARRDVIEITHAEGPSLLEVTPPARFRVIDALVDRLSALDEPALLVLDDLHWADPATVFAVAALGRRSSELGIGVLAAFRPSPRSPELARAIDVLGGAEPVGALGDAETAALLGRAVGATPGPRLRSLAARTGGNPLLLLELVAAARDEGRLEAGEVTGTGVPSSLRTSVGRRLRALGDPAADVLRMAAILGQSFTIEELAVVTGRPVRELVDPLRAAIAAGLLRETAGGLGFRHDLLREAVADETPATLRAALHREAARVLQESGAPIERVAAHLVRGASQGDTVAVAVLAEAAARAGPAAPAAALDLVDAALEIASADDPHRPFLSVHRADLLVWTGRPAEAVDVATAALTWADGDLADLARAIRSQALFMLGRPQEALDTWSAGATGDAPRRGDGEALGTAAGALASLFASDVPGASARADLALSLAAAARDDPWAAAARSVALATRSWCRTVEGRFREALADSAEAVRVADADPARAGHRYHPNVTRAMVLSSAGEHEGRAGGGRTGPCGRPRGRHRLGPLRLPVDPRVDPVPHRRVGRVARRPRGGTGRRRGVRCVGRHRLAVRRGRDHRPPPRRPGGRRGVARGGGAGHGRAQPAARS